MTKQIDLKISTKYDRPDKRIELHPNLMKVPFYSLVIGRGMSGKSLLIANLIHKYKSIFKDGDVILFTHSHANTIMELRTSRKTKIFDCITNPETKENRVEKLLAYQKSRKAAKLPLDHYLIIFDDFISAKELNSRRGIFTKIFSQARNYNVSVLLTSQEYKLIPAPVRKMSQYNLFYKVFNAKEKEAIVEENCSYLPVEEFEVLLEHATNKKFNFLMCDVDGRRFLHNFDYTLDEYKWED